jgi:hypothetical protein
LGATKYAPTPTADNRCGAANRRYGPSSTKCAAANFQCAAASAKRWGQALAAHGVFEMPDLKVRHDISGIARLRPPALQRVRMRHCLRGAARPLRHACGCLRALVVAISPSRSAPLNVPRPSLRLCSEPPGRVAQRRCWQGAARWGPTTSRPFLGSAAGQADGTVPPAAPLSDIVDGSGRGKPSDAAVSEREKSAVGLE